MQNLTARKENLTPQVSPRGESRLADLGGYTVDFGSAPAGIKLDAEHYHGLPNESCPCPHWGVMIKGRWKVEMVHGERFEVHTGDVYYLPPGHRLEAAEETEYIEFSPHELHRQTREAVIRNQAAHSL